MKSRIQYTQPSISELEVQYVTDAARYGWGPRCYEYIERFEAAFSRHLGVKYAIATSSCTGALHMGLAALGIGPGDEVILADSNWIASVAPAVHLGATPVFVDICEDTWCLDPAKVEQAITPRTRAIIAVHLYGNLCAMDELLAIGARHGIAVIEDAAEAIGSEWQGQRAGSMGRFGVFSFHGTKTMTTGEGGMFVTSDADLFERVLGLSNHGRLKSQTRQFWPDLLGFKYKISNLQAAIGCAQTERIEELIERKRAIMANYRRRLGGLPGLSLNPEPEGTRIGAWMPTVVFDTGLGITRERLLARFAEENIDARVFFYPLSALPMFQGRIPAAGGHSASIPERSINLPSFHDMTEADIERICGVVETLHAEAGR